MVKGTVEERTSYARRKSELSLRYPVTVVSSYCTTTTRTVMQKTRYGVVKRQVTFSNLELEQTPVIVYHAVLKVVFKGTTSGQREYRNVDYSFLKVLITSIASWYDESYGEFAKKYIGQKLEFPLEKVKELI